MSHPNRGFLAPKWVTHHFWEIHICGAAPLSINAILPICEGLIAARMTLCAVVNTSHPHIPETHQESRMKAFVGWRQIEDFGLEMRCGRVRLTLFFPLHNSNFLYQIENVVCYPFRTANLVDNGTKEGQIGEGCQRDILGFGCSPSVLNKICFWLCSLVSFDQRLSKKLISLNNTTPESILEKNFSTCDVRFQTLVEEITGTYLSPFISDICLGDSSSSLSTLNWKIAEIYLFGGKFSWGALSNNVWGVMIGPFCAHQPL